tara:strand:+ start:335 stop:703 length:369 start_codon:yes stop_codon:yes gene_type:complete
MNKIREFAVFLKKKIKKKIINKYLKCNIYAASPTAALLAAKPMIAVDAKTDITSDIKIASGQLKRSRIKKHRDVSPTKTEIRNANNSLIEKGLNPLSLIKFRPNINAIKANTEIFLTKDVTL